MLREWLAEARLLAPVRVPRFRRDKPVPERRTASGLRPTSERRKARSAREHHCPAPRPRPTFPGRTRPSLEGGKAGPPRTMRTLPALSFVLLSLQLLAPLRQSSGRLQTALASQLRPRPPHLPTTAYPPRVNRGRSPVCWA